MKKTLFPDQERIIAENESFLVINKKCGEDSQQLCGKNLFPVHRLDMPVSGCQLLAKTRESAAFLSALFAGGENANRESKQIKKIYWAIVEKPNEDFSINENWIDLRHWIFFDSKKNKSYANGDNKKPDSKEAFLRYRFTGAGENYLFAEIDLITGRHHQIRAQFAAAGLHVKGDLKYGARRSEKSGGIRLHARCLCFPNPLNRSELITALAPPLVVDPLWEAFTSFQK